MRCALLAIVAVVGGCGRGADQSSETLASDSFGVIPEYVPSQAVLIDQSLFLNSAEEGSALIKAVADTNVDLWFTGSNEPTLHALLTGAGIPVERMRFFAAGPSQNPWTRDYGPMATNTPSGRAFLDFDYQQEDGDAQDSVPALLGDALGTPVIETGMKLEGGNLTCDDSTCLVTHQGDRMDRLVNSFS